MQDALVQSVARVLSRATALAREDAELREALSSLGKSLVSLSSAAAPPQQPAVAPTPPPQPVFVRPQPATLRGPTVIADAPPPPPLTFAAAPPPVIDATAAINGSSHASSHGNGPTPPGDVELALVEKRCRLKAEVTRWAAERFERMVAGASPDDDAIVSRTRELIDRAEAFPDCRLWMLEENTAQPHTLDDTDDWRDLAGSFEVLADAAAVARGLAPGVDATPSSARNRLVEALTLLAEAQSAVYHGVSRVGAVYDRDQTLAFVWLKTVALHVRQFLPKFMQRDGPGADPSNHEDLGRRVAELRKLTDAVRASAEAGRAAAAKRQQLTKKVDYHAKRIAKAPADDHAADWQTIVDAVTEAVRDGLPPSNAELRDRLLPVLDLLPSDEGDEDRWPAEFQRVLREADRYLASRPDESSDEPVDDGDTPDIAAVRELLRGRTVVLIGGVRKPTREAALVRAFDLAGLDWIVVPEHESLDTFEPHIARPEVALVIVMIRWSSHIYGDLKRSARRNGKAFCQLPAGYSPAQVASQVLAQCSGQLGTAATAMSA